MTEHAKSFTLAELEAEVDKTIRFRGASTEGEGAISIADQVIARVAEILAAGSAVAGASAKPFLPRPSEDVFKAHPIGVFGLSILGTASHKYAFGIRLVGHQIDVTTPLFLIPGRDKHNGRWLYALDFKSFGDLPPSEEEQVDFIAKSIVKDLSRKALEAAKAAPNIK